MYVLLYVFCTDALVNMCRYFSTFFVNIQLPGLKKINRKLKYFYVNFIISIHWIEPSY